MAIQYVYTYIYKYMHRCVCITLKGSSFGPALGLLPRVTSLIQSPKVHWRIYQHINFKAPWDQSRRTQIGLNTMVIKKLFVHMGF